MEIYREYELKFYLNARHYILVGGHKGEEHPHTLNIRISGGTFTPFTVFEEGVSRILAPYQNRLLNRVSPFDEILPTLENMVDCFAKEFQPMIRQVGGQLIRIRASEGPSRAYILDLSGQDPEPEEKARQELKSVADSILEDILTDL